MSNEIIAAIRVVSYVVILIIMAVMANTMAMSARERSAEYATLKVLGFGPGFIALLIFGESFAICAIGGALGVAATVPVAAMFKNWRERYSPFSRSRRSRSCCRRPACC